MGAANPISISIRPWLRAEYASATALEFAAPAGLMRLTPDSAALLERTTSPLADLTLDVMEAF